jgi:hypothetical protein
MFERLDVCGLRQLLDDIAAVGDGGARAARNEQVLQA